MTAARRLVTDYPLEGLTQTSAPPVSEITPGVLRLVVSTWRKTPYGFGSLGDVPVQVGEASVLRKDGPDPIDGDEKPARLAWIGKLICLLTAVSTSSTIVWALVG